MDWTTFIGTVAVLLFAVIPMMAFPKASEDIITGINSAISDLIGSIYLFMGLAIFCFLISHLVNMVMSTLVKKVINQNLIHLHGRQCCFVQA